MKTEEEGVNLLCLVEREIRTTVSRAREIERRPLIASFEATLNGEQKRIFKKIMEGGKQKDGD